MKNESKFQWEKKQDNCFKDLLQALVRDVSENVIHIFFYKDKFYKNIRLRFDLFLRIS